MKGFYRYKEPFQQFQPFKQFQQKILEKFLSYFIGFIPYLAFGYGYYRLFMKSKRAPKNNWRIAAFLPIATGILFSLYAFVTGYLPKAEYFALYMIIGNVFFMFFAAICIAMAEPEK